MDWAFYYEGPREAETDFDCVTCLAGKRQKCPTHGTSFQAEGCDHCRAAQGGPCHAHWGLAAALEHHPVEAEAKKDWDAAVAFTKAEMAALPAEKKRVRVKLRGDALKLDSGALHREYHLELFAF